MLNQRNKPDEAARDKRQLAITNKPSQRKNNPQPVAFSPEAGHEVMATIINRQLHNLSFKPI